MKRYLPNQILPIALCVTVLAVYLSTICPTVYMGDSGEFIAAAFCLGIPHNSGYPVYGLLGKLFSFMPLGHIALRINVMSAFFGLLTVFLVYGLIFKITSSKISAFAGSLLLAFAPILWLQTVSAEVYTLHAFFVVLLMRLLYWWDEERSAARLALFVFATGISFGNHMQTVMLAPAALFIVLSSDHRTLLRPKNFFAFSTLFVLALTVYLYLPIRTNAGAAIHWGDPNSLERFLSHVTAKAHREGYVMTKGGSQYLSRTLEALTQVGMQFGVALVLALIGWFKLATGRWRVFFAAVIVFDYIYTVFLNIISLEITPFGLSTCISLAILSGAGIAHILKAAQQHPSIGRGAFKTICGAFCVLPLIPLLFNYRLCDQSRNYTAYEHTLNVFRTVSPQGTLFLDGDNNLFPVTYSRLVEQMREDVILYDRYDVIFKMPFPDNLPGRFYGDWKDLQPIVEQRIMEKAQHGTFLAAYDPHTLSLSQGQTLLPYGVLYRVFKNEEYYNQEKVKELWDHYATEAFYDEFHRDYMTREVSAYFFFGLSKFFFMSGQPATGYEYMKSASQIGYNDTMIHSDIAVFLIDHGRFDEAEEELKKASRHYDDLSGIYNNWGYYYYKRKDYEEAASFYHKAIELRPENFRYYNNLGLALFYGKKQDQAAAVFQQSLARNESQPKLIKFLEEHKIAE